MTAEQIAEIVHNANRDLCHAHGDDSQPPWGVAPDWQQESAISGVRFHLTGRASPEESHLNWCREKVENGWEWGTVKDPNRKTHPCLVPYCELPPEQQAKDRLFAAIVDALAPLVPREGRE